MGGGQFGDGRLFAWHRWLAGWVSDDEIRCVSPAEPSTHRLRNLVASVNAPGDGAAAVVVPTSANRGVVIENRGGRVVVYLMDLTRVHGSGPVEVVSTGFGVGQEPNTSLQVGEVAINIKDCDTKSCFVQVRPAA